MQHGEFPLSDLSLQRVNADAGQPRHGKDSDLESSDVDETSAAALIQVVDIAGFRRWRSTNSECIVHLKGFVSGMSACYNEQALDQLASFSILVWDGDLPDDTGFVSLVPAFLYGSPQRRAVAFVTRCAVDAFQLSWKHRVANFGSQILVVAVDVDSDAKDFGFLSDLHCAPSLPQDAQGVLLLGRIALKATGGQYVVALGGGGVVRREAEASVREGVQWTVYALSRGKQEDFPTLIDWAALHSATGSEEDSVRFICGADPSYIRAFGSRSDANADVCVGTGVHAEAAAGVEPDEQLEALSRVAEGQTMLTQPLVSSEHVLRRTRAPHTTSDQVLQQECESKIEFAASSAGDRGGRWQYRPFNGLAMDIRAEPRIFGSRSASVLQPGECFDVVETVPGEDAVFDHFPGGRELCVPLPFCQIDLLEFTSWRASNTSGDCAFLKGWAQGSPRNCYDAEVLCHLQDFQLLALDCGRLLEFGGLTAVISAFLRGNPSRWVVAFVKHTGVDDFRVSWPRESAAEFEGRVVIVAVDVETDAARVGLEWELGLVKAFPKQDRERYLLGRIAEKNSGSKLVLALGGEGVLGPEAVASFADGVHWIVYALSRGRKEEVPTLMDWACQASSPNLHFVFNGDPDYAKAFAGVAPHAPPMRVLEMGAFKSWFSSVSGSSVHIKGFGSGMGDFYDDMALGELGSFSMIAWESDPPDSTGYTSLVSTFLSGDSTRQAVAFLNRDSLEQFQVDWQHQATEFVGQIIIVPVDIEEEVDRSGLCAEMDRVRALPQYDQESFLLGRISLLATGSKRVIALGGDSCASKQAEASLGDVHWTVFALSRGHKEKLPTLMDFSVQIDSPNLSFICGRDPNYMDAFAIVPESVASSVLETSPEQSLRFPAVVSQEALYDRAMPDEITQAAHARLQSCLHRKLSTHDESSSSFTSLVRQYDALDCSSIDSAAEVAAIKDGDQPPPTVPCIQGAPTCEEAPGGRRGGENSFPIVRQYDAFDAPNGAHNSYMFVSQDCMSRQTSWATCEEGAEADLADARSVRSARSARSVRSMKSARSWTSDQMRLSRTSSQSLLGKAPTTLVLVPRPLSFPTVRIQTARWAVTIGAAGGAFGLAVGVVSGALAGAPPALLTLGLSLPAGAIVGGSIGLSTGFVVGAGAGAMGGGMYALRTEMRDGFLFPEGTLAMRPGSQLAVTDGSRRMATALGAAGGALVGGTAGGTTGTVGGGILGGALGIAAAPFTLGLSIPVGMVVGGGVGLCTGVVAGSSAGALGGGAACFGGHTYRAEMGQAWRRTRGRIRVLSDRARRRDLKLLDLPRVEGSALETSGGCS